NARLAWSQADGGFFWNIMENNPTPPAAAAPAPSASLPAPSENVVRVEGILDLDDNKAGTLLDISRNGKHRPTDPFVPRELIRRFKLKQGSVITATATPDERFPNPKVRFIEKVDGLDIDARRRLPDFTPPKT